MSQRKSSIPRRVTTPAKKKKTKSNNINLSKKQQLRGIAEIAAAVIIVVTICLTSGPKDYKEALFVEGVKVEGIDVAGKGYDDVKDEVALAVEQRFSETVVKFTSGENEMTFTMEELGASYDFEAFLIAAVEYGNIGKDRRAQKRLAASEGVNICAQFVPDDQKLAELIAANTDKYLNTGSDAKAVIETSENESTRVTSASITLAKEVYGKQVDIAALTEQIKTNMANNAYDSFEAPLADTTPTIMLEELEAGFQLIGEHTSSFNKGSLSGKNREFNIWKMCTVINGVEIKPGETWSINEEAGDRTVANGWAEAAGIKYGVSVQEAGGGICQVSSTLYNAILKADWPYEDLSRKHHSWPSEYMDVGLDATISSGAPDFKITNNRKHPIYIVAECDGVNNKVTVKIYGMKLDHDLKIKLYSDITKTIEPSQTEEVRTNESAEPGSMKVLRNAKTGYVVDVYRQYYKADGTLDHQEKLYTDYYNAFTKIVEYGPELSPSPIPSVIVTPSKDPEPQPPTPSVEPQPETSPQPEA